jgi:hypothetical protein
MNLDSYKKNTCHMLKVFITILSAYTIGLLIISLLVIEGVLNQIKNF